MTRFLVLRMCACYLQGPWAKYADEKTVAAPSEEQQEVLRGWKEAAGEGQQKGKKKDVEERSELHGMFGLRCRSQMCDTCFTLAACLWGHFSFAQKGKASTALRRYVCRAPTACPDGLPGTHRMS